MTILFITHYSGTYGANLALLQCIIEMRRKHNITPIVLMPKYGPICNYFDEQGIKYIIKYFKESKTWIGQKKKNRIIWGIKNIKNYWGIYQIVKSLNIDLIYSNTSIINIGAFLKLLMKKPHIWHIREYGIDDYQLSNIFGVKYESFIFNHFGDAFVAISKAIEKHAKAFIHHDLVHLIYDGVSIQDRHKFQSRQTNETLQLVCVGALVKQKKQDTLIEMANVLKHKLNEDRFMLNIVGDGIPEYETELKHLVEKYDLNNNVVFWGYRKDIPEILSKMDVGITPSSREAFGRTTVEYMLHNLLAVGRNTGGTAEIIEDGQSGLIYGTTEELAEKIRDVINDRKKYQEIANNGKKRAYSQFSSERNSEEIYQLCKFVLQRNRG